MSGKRSKSQPSPEPEGFEEALAAARYRASRLLSARAHALEPAFSDGAVDAKLEVVTGLRARMQWEDRHGATFQVSIRMYVAPEQEGEPEPILLELERILVYSHLPEGCSDEVLLRLADTLAVSHAWPLLHADVIDLTTRLGLPPIPLPAPANSSTTPPPSGD